MGIRVHVEETGIVNYRADIDGLRAVAVIRKRCLAPTFLALA